MLLLSDLQRVRQPLSALDKFTHPDKFEHNVYSFYMKETNKRGIKAEAAMLSVSLKSSVNN